MPIVPPLESDLFGFIAGLPMHPLVVHAAVVLLPLSAIALIVLVFAPKLRRSFGWLTVAGLAAGTGAAFVAKESGEALAARVGLPADHALWGDILVPVSLGLFVVAVVWLVLARRAGRRMVRSLPATVLGILSALLAVTATAITVLVGHSGAEAVWAGGVGDEPAPTSTSAAASYSLAEVNAHGTASDCWTAINATVYNLTAWEGRHPGGQQVITGLCGTDGTAAYRGEHGSQKKPASALIEFAIGTLSGFTASASATLSTNVPPTASATATGKAPSTRTMTEVKQHASASSCWSAVDGEVYDLTKWVDRHPGGSKRILAMCGQDGSSEYHSQHGSKGRAAITLDGYSIGKLV